MMQTKFKSYGVLLKRMCSDTTFFTILNSWQKIKRSTMETIKDRIAFHSQFPSPCALFPSFSSRCLHHQKNIPFEIQITVLFFSCPFLCARRKKKLHFALSIHFFSLFLLSFSFLFFFYIFLFFLFFSVIH